MAVTNTSGGLGTIYDRLRKRSLRSINRRRYRQFTGRPTEDWVTWVHTDHYAYVAGVRDALNAVTALREDA